AAHQAVHRPGWRRSAEVPGRGATDRPRRGCRRGQATARRGQQLLFTAMSTDVQRWLCESCGYIYDVAEGDPDGGILPGTAFADIPESWYCPVCGARKKDFVPYED
ncbi:MAG: hypothetical protein QOF77_689, partial [Solirubrobacteraceae bacterium]|nr:hypothetical protein [Solirubrobacteraceae bacterium]